MNKFFKTNSLIDETAATVKRRTFFQVALTFLIIHSIGSLAAGIIATLPMGFYAMQDESVINAFGNATADPNRYMQEYYDAINGVIEKLMSQPPAWFNAVQLFATVATIIAVFIYCTKIEKRRLFTLGFVKKGAVTEYLIGLIIGLFMFSAAYGTVLLSGEYEFGGFNNGASAGVIILFFIGFIIQGASEEILLRGYFFVSGSASSSLPTALFVSSALFAAMHLSNPGINLLAVINLFLFGVFAALYFLRRGNIWGICAIHSVWNFAQGNLYGCKVSGLNMNESLFSSIEKGGTLWSGGDFGPEGGIGVTVVLSIGIFILTFMKNKNIENFFVRKDKEFISA